MDSSKAVRSRVCVRFVLLPKEHVYASKEKKENKNQAKNLFNNYKMNDVKENGSEGCQDDGNPSKATATEEEPADVYQGESINDKDHFVSGIYLRKANQALTNDAIKLYKNVNSHDNFISETHLEDTNQDLSNVNKLFQFEKQPATKNTISESSVSNNKTEQEACENKSVADSDASEDFSIADVIKYWDLNERIKKKELEYSLKSLHEYALQVKQKNTVFKRSEMTRKAVRSRREKLRERAEKEQNMPLVTPDVVLIPDPVPIPVCDQVAIGDKISSQQIQHSFRRIIFVKADHELSSDDTISYEDVNFYNNFKSKTGFTDKNREPSNVNKIFQPNQPPTKSNLRKAHLSRDSRDSLNADEAVSSETLSFEKSPNGPEAKIKKVPEACKNESVADSDGSDVFSLVDKLEHWNRNENKKWKEIEHCLKSLENIEQLKKKIRAAFFKKSKYTGKAARSRKGELRDFSEKEKNIPLQRPGAVPITDTAPIPLCERVAFGDEMSSRQIQHSFRRINFVKADQEYRSIDAKTSCKDVNLLDDVTSKADFKDTYRELYNFNKIFKFQKLNQPTGKSNLIETSRNSVNADVLEEVSGVSDSFENVLSEVQDRASTGQQNNLSMLSEKSDALAAVSVFTRNPHLTFQDRIGSQLCLSLFPYQKLGETFLGDELRVFVLQWNPSWLRVPSNSCPPICNSYRTIRPTYNDDLHYYNTYTPLLLLNLWLRLASTSRWNPATLNTFCDRMAVGELYGGHTEIYCHFDLKNICDRPKIADVLLCTATDTDGSFHEFFGLVNSVMYKLCDPSEGYFAKRAKWNKIKIRFMCTLAPSVAFKTVRIQIVSNLRVTLLKNEALQKINKSFRDIVLDPKSISPQLKMIRCEPGHDQKLLRDHILQALDSAQSPVVLVDTSKMRSEYSGIPSSEAMSLIVRVAYTVSRRSNVLVLVCTKRGDVMWSLAHRLRPYDPIVAVRSREVYPWDEELKDFTVEELRMKGNITDLYMRKSPITLTVFSSFVPHVCKQVLFNYPNVVCIVVGADECTEDETALPLSIPSVKKLILMGNPLRLVSRLPEVLQKYRYHVSLFRRLYEAQM